MQFEITIQKYQSLIEKPKVIHESLLYRVEQDSTYRWKAMVTL